MKTRWPLKQTMPIRWSAASWRPTIKLASSPQQPGRPDAVRNLGPQSVSEGRDAQDASAWI